MTKKTYRHWAPHERFLLPPSPAEWLPEDHLAYFVLDIVEQLDLGPFHEVYQAKDPRGERPFPPSMMVALLVYAYATGTMSSRQIERKTYEDVAFRLISGENHPTFSTICRFRRRHAEHFRQLFVDVLRVCREMGMVELGRVTIDGTKLKASASKHRAMSYDHMLATEKKLEEEIGQLLALAERTDADEDELFGPDGRPYDIPEELARRKVRKEKIRAAREALEQESREARASELRENAARNESMASDATLADKERKAAGTRAATARAKADALDSGEAAADDDDVDDDDADNSGELPTHEPRHLADGTPHPRAQRNFTDPDSRIMEHQGGFVQAYNAQAVVSTDGFIVACGLSNQAPDTHYFCPLLARLIDTGLGLPDVALADSGYWAPGNAEWAVEQGIRALIATGRESYLKPWEIPDPEGPASAPSEPRPPPRTKEEMREAVRSREGWQMYKHRKHQAEAPFGIVKQVMGFRQTAHRGMRMVQAEWELVCAAFDILKLHRANA